MQSRIGIWGGSCAIRIPKAAVESLGLREGENVEIHVDNGSIIIKLAKPHYELADLVAQAQTMTPPESWDDLASGDETL